jgi:electron transport complex protein RnfD
MKQFRLCAALLCAVLLLTLLPVSAASLIIFGLKSLSLIATCVIASVLSEFLFNIACKKEQTVSDLSAAVTGLILALNLPTTVDLWQAAVGSVVATVVVKCLFGGIGRNVVNPAATARVFMLVAFSALTKPAFPQGADAVSGATPLAELAAGKQPELMDLFLGNIGGCIGETCTLALLIGGVYLLARKVIMWHTPVAFIGTAFLFTLAVEGGNIETSLAWILSGGLFLGAIFMATDYVTSPATPLGRIVFGVGAGLITVLIRFWGVYPEGVSFAILIMNILNPFIDSLTARKLFGGKKK